MIPGFRFVLVVPFSFCRFSAIYSISEAHYSIYIQVLNYENLISLGLCFVLYAWCMINIFYQVFLLAHFDFQLKFVFKLYSKTQQSNKKEVLLFLQALIPCLLLILVNVYIQFSNGWSSIAASEFFQFECVHYPVLYLCLNK